MYTQGYTQSEGYFSQAYFRPLRRRGGRVAAGRATGPSRRPLIQVRNRRRFPLAEHPYKLSKLNAVCGRDSGSKAMNHSLIGADRNTHFKIVAVALISAIVLVVVGLIGRMDDYATGTDRLHTDGPVLKIGKPTAVTTRDSSAIR
jgi:hypothetical protein